MAEDRYVFFEVKIPFENIKIFSTALHLLQKIGREFTIEVEQANLTLRALNETKTAFGSIEFNENYFSSFMVNDTKSFSCKLAIKPVCVIIRNVKNVRYIKLSASRTGAEHNLSFEMNLTNGITRTHRLIYSDCEIMNALFEEEGCNYIKARPGVFCQLLDHLHRSPEVCVQATPNLFSVSSYHKANTIAGSNNNIQQQKAELQRHMTTGISVNIVEFDVYQFKALTQWDNDINTTNNNNGNEANAGGLEELIFCTKEVNSFLGFCEALDVPDFDFYFTSGGRASKYGCRLDGVSVVLILATIVSDRARANQTINNNNNNYNRDAASGVNRSDSNNSINKNNSNNSSKAKASDKPSSSNNNKRQSSSKANKVIESHEDSRGDKEVCSEHFFDDDEELREAVKMQTYYDNLKNNNNTTSSSSHSSSRGSVSKTNSRSKASKASKKSEVIDVEEEQEVIVMGKKNKAKQAQEYSVSRYEEQEEAEFDEPLPQPLPALLNNTSSNSSGGSRLSQGGALSSEQLARLANHKKHNHRATPLQAPEDVSVSYSPPRSPVVTRELRSASKPEPSAVNRYTDSYDKEGNESEGEVEWSESQPATRASTVTSMPTQVAEHDQLYSKSSRGKSASVAVVKSTVDQDTCMLTGEEELVTSLIAMKNSDTKSEDKQSKQTKQTSSRGKSGSSGGEGLSAAAIASMRRKKRLFEDSEEEEEED